MSSLDESHTSLDAPHTSRDAPHTSLDASNTSSRTTGKKRNTTKSSTRKGTKGRRNLSTIDESNVKSTKRNGSSRNDSHLSKQGKKRNRGSQCKMDSDCSTGSCSPKTHICIDPREFRTCSEPGKTLCLGVNVICRENGFCLNSNYELSRHGVCTYNYDCPDPMQYCYLGYCVNRVGVNGKCYESANCQKGLICVESHCYVICESEKDCPANSNCIKVNAERQGRCMQLEALKSSAKTLSPLDSSDSDTAVSLWLSVLLTVLVILLLVMTAVCLLGQYRRMQSRRMRARLMGRLKTYIDTKQRI